MQLKLDNTLTQDVGSQGQVILEVLLPWSSNKGRDLHSQRQKEDEFLQKPQSPEAGEQEPSPEDTSLQALGVQDTKHLKTNEVLPNFLRRQTFGIVLGHSGMAVLFYYVYNSNFINFLLNEELK